MVQSGSQIEVGMGLYISKAIVEGHHGRVGIESAPGQGTTIWFALPLASSPKEEANCSRSASLSAPTDHTDHTDYTRTQDGRIA